MSIEKTAPWPDIKRGLVAILRGVKPDEIDDIASALVEAGLGTGNSAQFTGPVHLDQKGCVGSQQ